MKTLYSLTVAAAVAGLTFSCGPQAAPHTAPQTTTPVAQNERPRTIEEAEILRTEERMEAWEDSIQAIATAPGQEQARAAALLANHLFAASRWSEAATALERAAELNPLIAPYLRVRRIEALARMEQWNEAIAEARNVTTSAPGTAAAIDATTWLPALHARAGNAEAAASTLEDVIALNVDTFTEAGMVRTADHLASAGQADLARQLRWQILTRNPTGAYTEKLWSLLRPPADPQSPVVSLSTKEALALADRLARVNRLDQSLDLLDWLTTRDPKIAEEGAYRTTRSNALFRSRRYTDATQITPQPGDPDYLERRLRRGHAFWRSERPDEFVREMESLISDHPTSSEAAQARLLLASYYVTDVNEPARSVEYLTSAIEGGAVGNQGENLWRLGWTHTIGERYDDALEVFDRYLEQFPDHDYTMNALFWSAKIHEDRGNTAARDAALRQIIKLFPYNYYAYRAREMLGDTSLPSSQIASGEVFPDVSRVPPELATRLEAVRELLRVGLDADAARELRLVARDRSDDPVTAWHLALLWDEANRPLEAMGLLQRSFPSIVRRGAANVPDRFWQIIYPFPYAETIRREAERRDLSPYQVAAIIRQESAFNPNVVSNAGAVGLMQIMPEELDRITARGGLPSATRDDLFDPERNIAIGAAEFRQKLDNWDGDRMLAIASYNAGETPVKRWIDRYTLEDRDFFIESIPYAETRLYVKIIERNLHEYRRVWEN